MKVGAINYIVEGKNHKNLASTGYRPYTILCSEKFIDRMLKEAEPGYLCSKYLTGDNFTYTDAGVYTTINAGYLSTDYVIADISAEYGIRMDNSRERYASYIQEDMQNLILIFSGSGSVCLILIMVIWNTLRLEAEEEKRSFGILQAIGMSKRQMKKRILRSSLTVGGMAVLGGWIIYVGYDLAAALQQQKFLVEEFNEFRSLKSILEMSLYHRRLDGMNLIFILGISVAAMAVIILIYYVSKKCLFEKDVLAKLREER